MSAEVIRDLARVKAIFQLRAIETVIRGAEVFCRETETDCQTCNGLGELVRTVGSRSVCPYDDTVKCSDCDGTGKVFA